MKRWKAVMGGVAAFALVGLAGFWQPAQADDPTLVGASIINRSLISNQFTHMGYSGQNPELRRSGVALSYPRNGSAGYGGWGLTMSAFTSNQKSQVYNEYAASGGEGIWIGQGGKLSTTGPKLAPQIAEYIDADPYNPIGQEEENWGVPNPMAGYWTGRGLGLSAGSEEYLSNYWPGITATDNGSMYGADLTDLPITGAPARIANYHLFGYIDDTTIPEEVIITRWKDTKHNISAVRRVYDWANQDFDDFYISEVTFTNAGTSELYDVYFGFKNGFASCAMGITEQFGWSLYAPSRAIDDIIWFTESAGYSGAAAGYKAVFKRDSDDPITRPWDDTGDPRYKALENSAFDILQTEGQLCSPSTHFYGVLAYADDAGMFSFNDWDRGKFVQPKVADQPYGWQWWHQRSETDFDDPNPNTTSEADLYGVLATSGYQDNPSEANPDDRKAYLEMMSFGPYDIPVGESVRIVLVWGAGHPSQMRVAPAGTQQMDPTTWDRSSETVEKHITEMKTLGEQAAFENLQLAHFVYDANYQLPAAPTEAFISAEDKESSPNARQQISWRDPSDRAINPWKGEADIQGYRVYRSTWLGWGPWELWDTIPKGSSDQSVNGKWTYSGGWYQYEDKLSAAGFAYHYSVRPYATGYTSWTSTNGKTIDDIPIGRVKSNVTRGYESGWAPPTARIYDADERKPFQPTTPETDRLEKQVLVVPNPYLVDGKHQYPNSQSLRFVGIPSKSIIYIYSASGDLVKFLEHDNALKGEESWNQVTWNVAGQVQTGMYYYVVISRTSGSEGATQRGTFVIVK